MQENGVAITSSGVIHLLDPKEEEVNIADIVDCLSQIPRFNGHGNKFWSVAQHSVLVSKIVEDFTAASFGALSRKATLEGLIHDAAEAYLGDIIGPLRKAEDGPISNVKLNTIEDFILNIVRLKLGLPGFPDDATRKAVESADKIALAIEVKNLFDRDPKDFGLPGVDEKLYESVDESDMAFSSFLDKPAGDYTDVGVDIRLDFLKRLALLL